MTIIHEIADIMQEVLTTTADDAAKESGFVQRQSKISGSMFVQALVFGFLADADATVHDVAQTADTPGIDVTDSGLFQRCTEKGAECLRLVLKKAVTNMLNADPTTVPVLQQFTDVLIRDSSTVTYCRPPFLHSRCQIGISPNASSVSCTINLRLVSDHGNAQ